MAWGLFEFLASQVLYRINPASPQVALIGFLVGGLGSAIFVSVGTLIAPGAKQAVAIILGILGVIFTFFLLNVLRAPIDSVFWGLMVGYVAAALYFVWRERPAASPRRRADQPDAGSSR